jgi:hypothetical protein
MAYCYHDNCLSCYLDNWTSSMAYAGEEAAAREVARPGPSDITPEAPSLAAPAPPWERVGPCAEVWRSGAANGPQCPRSSASTGQSEAPRRTSRWALSGGDEVLPAVSVLAEDEARDRFAGSLPYAAAELRSVVNPAGSDPRPWRLASAPSLAHLRLPTHRPAGAWDGQ